MSVTISYKGSQIASISTNASKTLKTGGKYCEDDIAIQNVESAEDTLEAYMHGTLTSVSSDISTLNGHFTLQEQDRLVSVSFPNLTVINVTNFLNHCWSLRTLNMPNLEEITGAYGIYSTDLREITLPKLKNIANRGLAESGGVTKIDIGNSTISDATFADSAFRGHRVLKTLVLRYSAVPTLGGTYALNGTPMFTGASDAYIYVPQALISEYQEAANWSYFYSVKPTIYQPIEGSDYEE